MASGNLKTIVIGNEYKITIRKGNNGQPDYVSLTDIAKKHNREDPTGVIQNWMRKQSTIEYLAFWEENFNPNYNSVEVDGFMAAAGSNAFTMSPKKWIASTNAIGIESKSGRYGGTFAHKDIALEFMSHLSPRFKLGFLLEYQQLKSEDMKRKFPEKNASALFLLPGNSGNGNAIFTSIPKTIAWCPEFENVSENDIINLALFGVTQVEFEKKYPKERGEIHNNSSINHVVVHEGLRRENFELLNNGLSKQERLKILNELAIERIVSLEQKKASPLIESDTQSEEVIITGLLSKD